MAIVSFGGGTNSTAMIVEMYNRGIQIDHITFSDTGGEKPWTYNFIHKLNDWLIKRLLPQITILKHQGPDATLEDECLRLGTLPPVAFGWNTCSAKWKIEPFKKWLKQNDLLSSTVCIGYDADESFRADRADAVKTHYTRRYPLIEWNMGREECIETIAAAGLPQPGKSACFFCPNSRVHEITNLPQNLLVRAIKIEENAQERLNVVCGLGRSWKWAELVNEDNQVRQHSFDLPCGCYDGD